MKPDIEWFKQARYGLFIHYGLYSILGRGEWVMNREAITADEYAKLAKQFTAENFDADDIIRRAKSWGMRYAVLTTKHHEGFCLYDSKLTDFTTVKTACGRDLVAEFIQACRKHDLKIGLYHSLNDWSTSPDAVDALEKPDKCYQPFIDRAHSQVKEIMTNYGKIDVMWYDGWWPFDGNRWQAEKLNAMVRSLQPGILVNGRCAVKGDFATPEGHISSNMEPWETCMTLNDNWGFHAGDNNWKSPKTIVEMLRKCSTGCGNLLLNIGLKPDGSIPAETIRILDQAGQWLKVNGESIYNTERFEFSLREKGDGRAEWNHMGGFTASGNNLYWHIRNWPGAEVTLAGVLSKVEQVTELSTGKSHPFTQSQGKVVIKGLEKDRQLNMPVVIKLETKEKPAMYLCGGSTVPTVPHCHYDPVESDILD